jgi:hypothetical protein
MLLEPKVVRGKECDVNDLNHLDTNAPLMSFNIIDIYLKLKMHHTLLVKTNMLKIIKLSL